MQISHKGASNQHILINVYWTTGCCGQSRSRIVIKPTHLRYLKSLIFFVLGCISSGRGSQVWTPAGFPSAARSSVCKPESHSTAKHVNSVRIRESDSPNPYVRLPHMGSTPSPPDVHSNTAKAFKAYYILLTLPHYSNHGQKTEPVFETLQISFNEQGYSNKKKITIWAVVCHIKSEVVVNWMQQWRGLVHSGLQCACRDLVLLTVGEKKKRHKNTWVFVSGDQLDQQANINLQQGSAMCSLLWHVKNNSRLNSQNEFHTIIDGLFFFKGIPGKSSPYSPGFLEKKTKQYCRLSPIHLNLTLNE